MITQDYAAYTATDQDTWARLYRRQRGAINRFAYKHFQEGLALLGMQDEKIPDLVSINKRLARLTGWSVFAVEGLIDNAHFFEELQERRFGATTWLRKPEQLDYLQQPDLFHDVFGHVPLLADPAICWFLSGLAGIACRFLDQAEVIEAIARLYWSTIEFGLVKEKEELKIYGAGILSSISETEYCFSGRPDLIPFDLEKVLATPYVKDNFQEQYFVIDNLSQLAAVLRQLERKLEPLMINKHSF